MSTSPATPAATAAPRRVREQAREAAALMVFSAAVSLGLALTFVLLARLGH